MASQYTGVFLYNRGNFMPNLIYLCINLCEPRMAQYQVHGEAATCIKHYGSLPLHGVFEYNSKVHFAQQGIKITVFSHLLRLFSNVSSMYKILDLAAHF
jgi:hypothetical protein